MLKLTNEEQAWLDAYREALNKKHPGTVQGMLIYGSKARGQAHAESDLDVLLVVRDKAAALKRELRWIGYLLAVKTDVLPSILANTKRNGKAGSEADHLSVERSSATRCASYETL
jgi:predicted nucleotidyltransferase